MFRVLYALSLLLGSMVMAHAESREWSWSELNYAPCEGVGIVGSYAVRMYGNYDTTETTRTLRSISLNVDSIAFGSGTPSVSAKLSAGPNAVILQRPWYSAIVAPNVVNLVLPPKNPGNISDSTERPFSFPKTSTLKIQISGLITTPAGSCALGVMNRDVTF